MGSKIIFSMLMPTLNAERTIERALRSIRTQDFPQDRIEIMVIDGGSTDRTLEIAEKYDVRILKNEQVIPETAKCIGMKEARGEWLVFFDSDEVLLRKDQLKRRYAFLKKNPDVYCYHVDRLIPGEGTGIASAYTNIVSDPFSYIVYANKGAFSQTYHSHLARRNGGCVYCFNEDDYAPLGDGGNTAFHLDKAKELFGDRVYTQEFAVAAFSLIIRKTGLVGCITGDSILHYSRASFTSFLRKLRFRIHINLNEPQKSGYSARANGDRVLAKRKFLFLIYCLLIVPVFVDSIRLPLIHRRWSLALHFVYTYYVFFVTIAEVLKKLSKKRGGDYRYG